MQNGQQQRPESLSFRPKESIGRMFKLVFVFEMFECRKFQSCEFCQKFTLENKSTNNCQREREWCSVNVVADCFDCCSLDCSLYFKLKAHTRYAENQSETGSERVTQIVNVVQVDW